MNRAIYKHNNLLQWSVVFDILNVRAGLLKTLHFLGDLVLVVDHRLDSVLRSLQTGHPKGLERTTTVNVNLDVLTFRSRVVVHESGTRKGVAGHVANRAQVATVATVTLKSLMVLLADSAVLAWVRVTSKRNTEKRSQVKRYHFCSSPTCQSFGMT